jgi:hypothetical protein
MVRGAEELAALRDLYVAKARAEQEAADALLPALDVLAAGDPLGRVLLVKGEAGEADVAAGEALGGADGGAARAALEALGIATDSVLAVVTRPSADTPAAPAAERLACYLESADPALVVALDAVAAADLAAAADTRLPAFGEPAHVRGRVLLAIDGLEASLTDEARKKRVWAQFRAVQKRQGRS